MPTPKSPLIEAYIDGQPAAARRALRRVRACFRRAMPDAEEVISYAIPAFRLHGAVALFFAGWKEHVSVYPVTAGIARALGEELGPYRASKGTLRFPLAEPVPVELIERIARARAAEAAEHARAKASKRSAKKKAQTRGVKRAP